MKIHGIVLVKNESDIIEFMLRQASEWADRIYVFDTGSTDDTWERVQRAARTTPAIVPYKSEPRAFGDELRGEVFRAFRHEAGADSWWCRLDSDEIYAEDPRTFLAHVPRHHHVVWAAHAQFYFTAEDVARCSESGPPPTIDETNRPRYYLTNASEPRFFRHRARLQWDHGAWPRHMGVVHPRRIPLRHLQYRSPQQIQRRLDTRREAAAAGYDHFKHSLQKRWREQIQDAKSLHYDDGRQPLVVENDRMPRHLETTWQRALKLLLHGIKIWP